TFGTVGLFTDQRYPADATTLADSIVISWSRMELFALIDRHPHIAVNVIQVIGKRLKEAQDRMRELSTQRVARRVAHAVLRLARQAGHNTGDGTVIEFPLTRSDVANMSGTTLHTASRVLAAWEKSGLLASDKQQVTLRRVTELQRIADDL